MRSAFPGTAALLAAAPLFAGCMCGVQTLHTGGTHDAGTHGGADAGDAVDAGPCTGIACGAGQCCTGGTECVAGACEAPCMTGVRCGSACCAAGQVCAGTCATPTTPCDDSVDCAGNEYCEPTLGMCLPDNGNNGCKLSRPFMPLMPTKKWSFTTPTALPAYNQTISAPLVVDMPSGGVHHTAVFITTSDAAGADGQAFAIGHLRRLDGLTGVDVWADTVDALSAADRVEATFSPAVGDLDHDGVVDIVAMAATGHLIAFDANGALKWRSSKGGSPFAFPIMAAAPSDPAHNIVASTIAIADMNGDGQVESVMGGVVFDSHGVVVSGDDHPMVGGFGNRVVSSIIADVDGDGVQDVVAGNAAWKMGGGVIWSNPMTPDGFPAIADFESDGVPELAVITANPDLRVLNATTGAVLAILPLEGAGGSPVIAQFHGAGADAKPAPEIAVQHGTAAGCAVSVYHYAMGQLTPTWSYALTSCSGLLTATAFDFNGDGKVEVIAHDDCRIAVLDGTNGDLKLSMAASHATWTEFVSVVDVDGNGVADLLFSTNDAWGNGPSGIATVCGYQAGEQASQGLFVFSDPMEKWMPTRRVWNQQAYHITNIRSDGSLPPAETASWSPGGYNNYRVSAQTKGTAADFAVSLGADLSMCPGKVTLIAIVANLGTQGAPAGVSVDFFSGTPPNGTPLGTAMTTMALLPGATETVTLTIDSQGGDFYVQVNGGGTIAECDTGNDVDAVHAACIQ